MGFLIGLYVMQLFIVALMLHSKDVKTLLWLGILLIPGSVYLLTLLGVVVLIGMGFWHIFMVEVPDMWKTIKELKLK